MYVAHIGVEKGASACVCIFKRFPKCNKFPAPNP